MLESIYISRLFWIVVILCKKKYKVYVFPEIVGFNKDDILNEFLIYKIHPRINIWPGKVIINWNHHKSMQAKIHTIFINEKIFRLYSFCPFSPWNTTQMQFRGVLWKKPVTPPRDPLKYPTVSPLFLPLKDGVKTKLFLFVYLVIITTTIKQ